MNHTELDCRGLSCPMPIVKISRAMKDLAPGDTLTVQASDPSFQSDIEAWVKKMDQTLQSIEETGDVQTAILVKKG